MENSCGVNEMQIIEQFITPDAADVALEGLALVFFVVVLIAAIRARKIYPAMGGLGWESLLAAVTFGIFSSAQDVVDEFIWFTSASYGVWKNIKTATIMISLILFAYYFFTLYRFSGRLWGKE